MHRAGNTPTTTTRQRSLMMRAFFALAVATQTATMRADAAHVTFKNQCRYPINVYDNVSPCPLSAASPNETIYGCEREIPTSIMYRHGRDPQATLAEFAVGSGKVWYDISIIPPGPENCGSLKACLDFTGKVGFNEPIMILPTKYWPNPKYPRCERLLCHYNGCPQAFQHPGDTQKVHDCPADEEFEVIFCP